MTAEIHEKPGLETLRAAISRLEGHSDRRRKVLPFGVCEIDSRQATFAPSLSGSDYRHSGLFSTTVVVLDSLRKKSFARHRP